MKKLTNKKLNEIKEIEKAVKKATDQQKKNLKSIIKQKNVNDPDLSHPNLCIPDLTRPDLVQAKKKIEKIIKKYYKKDKY